MIWRGTRKPSVSSSSTASGLPRCLRVSSHDGVAHGVVPCAMSPRTVTEPVEHRRPTARYCIADRSWASSSTTCASDGKRSNWSYASSTSTASAEDHFTAPTVRGAFGRVALHRTSACSSSVRIPSAAAASVPASAKSSKTTFAGSTAGHSRSTAFFTAGVRATASWVRSSGDSPACSIRASTACAMRRASIPRPAP